MLASADEIANLIFLVDEAADQGRFDDVGALFAHASMEVAGTDVVLRGAAAVSGQYHTTNRLYDGAPRTLHYTTNVVVDADDGAGRATARSAFTVYQQTEAFPLAPIVLGTNHDTFERVDGRWRFASRRIQVELAGDLSHHLAENPL